MQRVKHLYFVCTYTRARRSLCYLARSARSVAVLSRSSPLPLPRLHSFSQQEKEELAYLGAMWCSGERRYYLCQRRGGRQEKEWGDNRRRSPKIIRKEAARHVIDSPSRPLGEKKRNKTRRRRMRIWKRKASRAHEKLYLTFSRLIFLLLLFFFLIPFFLPSRTANILRLRPRVTGPCVLVVVSPDPRREADARIEGSVAV